MALALPAEGDTARRVPNDESAITLCYAPVVRRVGTAAIDAYAARVGATRAGSPVFGDRDGGPPRRLQSSLGLGVIVESDLVVTNHHVIENADEVRAASIGFAPGDVVVEGERRAGRHDARTGADDARAPGNVAPCRRSRRRDLAAGAQGLSVPFLERETG